MTQRTQGVFSCRNVEIKAELSSANYDRVRDIANSKCDSFQNIIQKDIFYAHPTSRLKLRTFDKERAEIIFYDRSDSEEPKESSYDKVSIAGESNVRASQHIFSNTFAIVGVVQTFRTVFVYENTRIHFDYVEDLGFYLELEAILEEHEDVASGKKRIAKIMKEFGIEESWLVSGAYIDLLRAKR
jgi:predicted adenylyl cyclase CyaB